MKIRNFLFLIILLVISSCKTQSFIKSTNSETDQIYLEFIDKPKKLVAQNEYRLKIFYIPDSKIELVCRVNQGSIKHSILLGSPIGVYTLKPYKPGDLIISFYKKEKDENGKTKMIKVEMKELIIE